MRVIAILLTALSALVALGNLVGCIGAHLNRKRGIARGDSNVPLVSLVLGLVGWIAAYPSLGFWPLTPALFDPGTWVCLYLPWIAWTESIRKKKDTGSGRR